MSFIYEPIDPFMSQLIRPITNKGAGKMKAKENVPKMTESQQAERDYLLRAYEHAPKTAGNPEIRGYWTEEGFYLCSDCGASIMARGCLISIDTFVWKDETGPYGFCICCDA